MFVILETGTRWKDYFLVTLLLSAIIGCWYAYQQNKNAKRHLRRMAKDMEGLQRAENALTEMQKVCVFPILIVFLNWIGHNILLKLLIFFIFSQKHEFFLSFSTIQIIPSNSQIKDYH